MSGAVRIEVIGDAKLYLGDCREILPTLTGIDACVTDPPYGMQWDGKVTPGKRSTSRPSESHGKTRHFGTTIVGDDAPFDPSFLLDFPEAIIWGFNHFPDKLRAGGALVWVKRNDQAFGSFLSDAEIAWFSKGCGVYCFRHVGEGAVANSNRSHPNQKPTSLMSWCLSFIKSQIIIDPFMGSGTTGVACAKAGRKFVGIEIDPTYFDVACHRIEEAQRHQDLFVHTSSEVAADIRIADLFP